MSNANKQIHKHAGAKAEKYSCTTQWQYTISDQPAWRETTLQHQNGT